MKKLSGTQIRILAEIITGGSSEPPPSNGGPWAAIWKRSAEALEKQGLVHVHSTVMAGCALLWATPAYPWPAEVVEAATPVVWDEEW